MTLASVVKRQRICLDCRTVLGEGEPCDGGPKHRVAELSQPQARERWINEVWGPPSRRRRAKQLAKAGGGGLGAGSALEGCGGCAELGGSGEVLAIIAAILVVALVVVVLYWVVVKIIEAIRAYRSRLKPYGAVTRVPRLRGGVVAGRVTGGAGMLKSPASGDPCRAFTIDLQCERFLKGATMLHDAMTAGFDVTLDDGRIARVPAGRVRLEGPTRRIELSATAAVEGHLATIDPGRNVADEFDPVPYDYVAETILKDGDRVEIFGDLDASPNPDAPAQDYRQPAAMMLSPKGVPAIRVHRA